jgi:Rps23 Pro-64 3,4-dihydroxylase Tpa1-like proline 4-hydroxylase
VIEMVLLEKTKEENYTRYRIRPLSDVVIGGEKIFSKLKIAELEAQYWAHETGSYYEIIEEEVHTKSLKVIAQDRTEVKEVV